ncbi:putative outer membrane lipoprotein [Jannaschia seosinensis]|uniref:Putative outer membrane lipoprotein n=1 Tax=Jannaschia seosinensis TaxID=313367 RepID=A0A0M7B8L8_9RHOB|nr:OmpA family protein [Jannaschia seosinensis]CUH30179.1 putative outer membrane lipoprotein [Jannaschia seosinensis]
MSRTRRTSHALRSATSLAASLSLLVPSFALVAPAAHAQTAEEVLEECAERFEDDSDLLAECVAAGGVALLPTGDGELAGDEGISTVLETPEEIEAEAGPDEGVVVAPVEEAPIVDDAVTTTVENIPEEEVEEVIDEPLAVTNPAEEAEATEEAASGMDAAEPEIITEEQSEEEAVDGVEMLEQDAEIVTPEAETEAAPEDMPAPETEPDAVTEEAPAAEIAPDADAPVDAAADDMPPAEVEETPPTAELIEDVPALEGDTPLVEELIDEPVEIDNAPIDAPAPDLESMEDAEAAEPVLAPETAPIVEVETESEIAEEVAARPAPEMTQEQEVARDLASQALQSALGVESAAAAAAAIDDAVEGEVEEITVEEADVRTSAEDFETRAVVTERKEDSGLSNTQKLALGALGALAVGTILNNRSRVVSNSGDRVVVQQDDGALQVFRDDDVLLRQAGSNVRTERFDDGSVRQTVLREDGSRVVTIRDASLRVLRRELIEPDGTRYTLIDDTDPVEPVDVATLPVAPVVSTRTGGDDALREALQRQAGIDRRFSLAQVRNIPEVRALAPAYEVNAVTFPSGSAAIPPEQAENLAGLAREVLASIRENPREVFLIEGHTDAVGDAVYNLALSDRRAESLALALNEYFGVPVENMVVQGYGERFLKVPTQEAERANRRATVRQITGLLQTAAAN